MSPTERVARPPTRGAGAGCAPTTTISAIASTSGRNSTCHRRCARRSEKRRAGAGAPTWPHAAVSRAVARRRPAGRGRNGGRERRSGLLEPAGDARQVVVGAHRTPRPIRVPSGSIAAVRVEGGTQPSERVMHPGMHGADRQPQGIGDLAGRHVHVVVQDEHRPVVHRQATEATLQLVPVDDGLEVTRRCRVVDRVGHDVRAASDVWLWPPHSTRGPTADTTRRRSDWEPGGQVQAMMSSACWMASSARSRSRRIPWPRYADGRRPRSPAMRRPAGPPVGPGGRCQYR